VDPSAAIGQLSAVDPRGAAALRAVPGRTGNADTLSVDPAGIETLLELADATWPRILGDGCPAPIEPEAARAGKRA
jgi:hypothetical protein